MTNKEWYAYCVDNGLCVSCHQPVSDGKRYCPDCVRRNRQRNNEQREAYIAKGICPVCRTNDLHGDEKTCVECKAKMASRNSNRSVQKIYFYNAERRKRLKAENKCIICGEPIGDVRHSTCEKCREKRRQEYAQSNAHIDRAHRADRGRCYICGSRDLADGHRLCKLCYKRTLKNTEKMWSARRKDKDSE